MEMKLEFERQLEETKAKQQPVEKTNQSEQRKTKPFAYLKELVDPKVRAEIDGLPFTTEVYERAKDILIGEYGKTREIVNA